MQNAIWAQISVHPPKDYKKKSSLFPNMTEQSIFKEVNSLNKQIKVLLCHTQRPLMSDLQYASKEQFFTNKT
jgi:hypothetical protein